MKCFKCGIENDNNAKFCISCGNPLETPQPNITTQVVQNPTQVINSTPNTVEQNNTIVQNQSVLNNQPPKKKKKHTGLIVFLVILVILGGIIGLITYKISSFIKNSTIFADNTEEVDFSFSKEYQYLGEINTGEYTIKKADPNISFFVTSETTDYKVYDQDGNAVDTILQSGLIKPSTEYEKGKTYKLVLNNGAFSSEQLKDAKTVYFTIKKDEVKNYKFNDNVVKTNNINVQDFTFTSNKNYNIGDVIVNDNPNTINEAYKIISKIDDTYTVENASLSDIYKELDFYYEDYVDLSNPEVSSELKKYIVYELERTPWYNFLVTEVDAAPKIKVDFQDIQNGIKVTITVTVNAGDNSIFLSPKYHNFELKITESLQIIQLIDISLTNWDVSFDITNIQDAKLEISNKNLKYSDLNSKALSVKVLEDIEEASREHKYVDEDTKQVDLTEIKIPTEIPGLSIDIDIDLRNQLAASIKFSAGVSTKVNIVAGFDAGIDEEFKAFGSFNYELSSLKYEFIGTIEDRLGLNVKVGVDLINTVKAAISLEAGVYENAKLTLTRDLLKDQYKISASGEIGLYGKVGVVASIEILNASYSHTFIDKKIPLASVSNEFVYPEEETEESTDENKNTALLNGEGDLTSYLRSNSCVLPFGDSDHLEVSFDYNQGKLNSTTVSIVNQLEGNNIDYKNSFNIGPLISKYIIEWRFDTKVNYMIKNNKSYITFNLKTDDLVELLGIEDNDGLTGEVSMFAWKTAIELAGGSCR